MFVNNGVRQCFTFHPGRITANLNTIRDFTMFINVKVKKCISYQLVNLNGVLKTVLPPLSHLMISRIEQEQCGRR